MINIAEKISDSERLIKIINGLKCSEEEAKKVLEYDKKVDRNEAIEYDLSFHQNKIAQSYTRTGTRKTPTNYQFQKRQRKTNATKAGIIAELAEFLTSNSQLSIENLEIPKSERMISFKIGEDAFELTLIQKRKK